MRRTPAARIASSTLNVAIVFCSTSFSGWCVPNRTSAFAARWNTTSAPAISAAMRSRSRVSPRTNRNRGFDNADSMNCSWPVERLS